MSVQGNLVVTRVVTRAVFSQCGHAQVVAEHERSTHGRSGGGDREGRGDDEICGRDTTDDSGYTREGRAGMRQRMGQRTRSTWRQGSERKRTHTAHAAGGDGEHGRGRVRNRTKALQQREACEGNQGRMRTRGGG